MFEVVENATSGTVIKVIGVGGAGGNAVDHMIRNGVAGVEFITANTDAQALSRTQAKNQIQLGDDGAGRGRQARGGRSRRDGGARPDRRRPARLAHGVHHRRHGRRHGHGRGPGGRGGRQGHGHPHRRGRHQAVLVRGRAPPAGRRDRHRGAVAARRLGHRDPQREARGGPGRRRVDGGGVLRGRQRAEERRRGHLRDHQRARPDQRRLPGRAHRDGRAGDGDDGLGRVVRRGPRAHRRGAGGRVPAARGRQSLGRAGRGGEHHRQQVEPQAARDQGGDEHHPRFRRGRRDHHLRRACTTIPWARSCASR